jgi:predicted AlkP superfamily pyrophosphatase or phosphodiesterase
MVVVISLDAFAAESLKNPELPAPTLRALMKSGAYAESMRPINPTVTWPNHTALVTGVDASRHHVLVNGRVEGQRTAAAELTVNPHAPKAELVAVSTVYDAVHAAHGTTAEVDWVAIEGAAAGPGATIDWSFAEQPLPESPVVREMLADGTVSTRDIQRFGKGTQEWRDGIYTRAAVEIVKRHHPNLLLLHLLALDSIEHKTGFGNAAGLETIAFLDARVKEVVEAVRAAGDMDRTTFLIVSDHGQESVHHWIRPNALLRQRGLQGKGTENVRCLPDGGFALVYQRNATAESRAKLRTLFEGQPGIRAVLTPEEAAKEGWPTPEQTDQAADLLLYARNDYAFQWGDEGPLVKDTAEVGQHGYPNTEPSMQAIFIASGRGIKPVGEIPPVVNLDVAGTIARLLGVRFEGGVVEGILE